MTDKNQTTEQKQSDEASDKKKARLELKKKAYSLLKELVDKQEDKKFENALKFVRPSLYGLGIGTGRISGGSISSKVISLIAEKKTVNEIELFKQFKVGRKNVSESIRKQLKKAEPNERKWITFDAKTGDYTLVSVGANPPKNWTGYVPVDNSVKLD